MNWSSGLRIRPFGPPAAAGTARTCCGCRPCSRSTASARGPAWMAKAFTASTLRGRAQCARSVHDDLLEALDQQRERIADHEVDGACEQQHLDDPAVAFTQSIGLPEE